jgi:hypothetical protein
MTTGRINQVDSLFYKSTFAGTDRGRTKRSPLSFRSLINFQFSLSLPFLKVSFKIRGFLAQILVHHWLFLPVYHWLKSDA